MRIISGIHKGRRINPPPNMPFTRPTTDIAKEGLFNILNNNLDFENVKSLDLFGGTGAISYELASRGVVDLTVVEMDKAMYNFIKSTAAELQIKNLKLIRSEVFKFIETCTEKYDFIFAGPPYALGTIDELPLKIMEKEMLTSSGIFVLEHTPRNDYKKFKGYRSERNYGTTIFSFFMNEQH